MALIKTKNYEGVGKGDQTLSNLTFDEFQTVIQWNPVNTTTNGPKYSGRINGVGSLSMMREQFNYFDVMSTLAN